jgi:putative multicomponent Na+:H+ antiporter subunit B
MNASDFSYINAIVALLPLTAAMLTVQVNPYNALVLRGILGAVAALVYAILGAADVALTEALVGTMLAITLYVVAVRSSLVMRIGVLKSALSETGNDQSLAYLIADLKTIASRYYLRLELISYPDPESLSQALIEKEVHATCIGQRQLNQQIFPVSESVQKPYHTATRIRRLYSILQTELVSSATSLAYVTVQDSGEKH